MTEIIVGLAMVIVYGALLVAIAEIERESRDARRVLEVMIEDVRRRAE